MFWVFCFPPRAQRRSARRTVQLHFESLEQLVLPSSLVSPMPGNPTVATLRADAPDARSLAGLTAAQKRRADQLISTFENSTPLLQYGYIENLDDGRGFTAGRAGFTTATGDLVVVVQRYTRLVPGNPLARFLTLQRRAADGSDSVVGLEELPVAWKAAARARLFRAVQDRVVDDTYYQPALRRSRLLGLREPLSLVVLYDTNIQHGEGNDPDGLPALIRRASRRAGGTPATGVDERKWLDAFLIERFKTLSHAFSPETRAAWRQSRDRVRVLMQFASRAQHDFAPPLTYTVYGDRFSLR